MARLSRSLLSHVSRIPDPRKVRGQRHKFFDIIMIAVVGALCGADSWKDLVALAQVEESWLRSFLELPNGIPSHDTFERVFSMIDGKAFSECFLGWVQALQPKIARDVVAIDGKTLRGSFDEARGKSALHMVSAWSSGSGLVLGQEAVASKSNEITAIPELLKMLDLKGCIVTIDAMGCQKTIATAIAAKKADYILALKGNHGKLHSAVKLRFADLQASPEAIAHTTFSTTERNRGRLETRRTTCVEDLAFLCPEERGKWKHLRGVVQIESERTIGDKTTRETRYYLTSLTGEAPRIAKSVRAHWGIENRLHWVLDASLREDQNRTRKGDAPETCAVLRHIVLNLLRLDPSPIGSIKSRRLRAALDREYRMKALVGFPLIEK